MESDFRMRLLTVVLIAFLPGVPRCGTTRAAASPSRAARIPVIYCTDLFCPPDDPDDLFDLATLFAMEEFDIKVVVLDQGEKQLQRPGAVPVWQLSYLTGRSVPTALGLARPLKSPVDKALDQPGLFQNGVAMILQTLRDSSVPVRIATVGSVRDVVAAFNREPELFRAKVARLMPFMGDASHPTFKEYNVTLDPQAYIGLMRSGLPIWWVPCFDGGAWQSKGHGSYWKTTQRDLLGGAPPELLQYFIYAFWPQATDQVAFLSRPVDSQRREQLFAMDRNLWGTALFGVLSGRRIVCDGGRYVSVLPRSKEARGHPETEDLFGFSEVDLSIGDDAVVRYGKTRDSHRVMRFEVRNKEAYAEGLTSATAGLLSKLRVRRIAETQEGKP